eukprot:1612930-Rhodomonas_salina.5
MAGTDVAYTATPSPYVMSGTWLAYAAALSTYARVVCPKRSWHRESCCCAICLRTGSILLGNELAYGPTLFSYVHDLYCSVLSKRMVLPG